MKEKMKKIIKNSGFTLVETLVAVSVLSLSILGTFTAVQNGLQKSTYVKDQIVAFYLAQEAMEYIHNIRDKNALDSVASGGGGNWLRGLSEVVGDPCYFGKTCRIDSPSATIVDCGGGPSPCSELYQSPPDYFFGYTTPVGWFPTKFKREIQFAETYLGSASKEVMVTVTVKWNNDTSTFQVKQLLMNNRM